MTPYKVELSPEAFDQAAAIRSWWIANRPAVPDLFDGELDAAIAALETTPGVGQPYALGPPGTRRLLMPRCRYHVYYVVDEAERRALVHAIWHTARGQGPRL